jgi:tetratricopeptide (TPR) repeat protein
MSKAEPLHDQAIAALNCGNFEQAENLLLRLLETAPADAIALQLMGVVRRSQDRSAEAESLYRRSIACDPTQPQTHHNLGILLRSEHRFEEAVSAFREAIRLKSNYVEAHLGLALSLSDLGDHESAVKSCRQALRIQPSYQLAQQALAAELLALDRPTEAERILRRMLASGGTGARTTAEIEHNLGDALRRQGRYEEALDLFAAARARAPGLPSVDYNEGYALRRLGRFEEAIASFRRALIIEPESAKILAAIALAFAQSNDFASAREFGERALARDPRHAIASIAVAIADMNELDFETAPTRIRIALDEPASSDNDQINTTLNIAADTLDRLDRVDQAFDLYSAMNERQRAHAAARFEHARVPDEVNNLATAFESIDQWHASPIPARSANAAFRHVFVLGFMRSGTTLLTAALARHEDVVAMDERELLSEPANTFLRDEASFAKLASLGPREIEQWRNGYWHSVAAAGFQVAGKAFVDKMPFNSVRLPLIARLFPDAKVVFAVRDPRDVVLSCFRRRFDLTPFSFEFLRVEDCAHFYASVMTLAFRYRERLPLRVGDFRYEDVVGNFEPTIRRVCDFIGINWQESMRDFAAAAGVIDPLSASASQVRRGLYGDAVGQWRRYREQLAPATTILKPWIEKFGYSAE